MPASRKATARSTRSRDGWSKLAVAVGAMRQGAVHSSVRKALDAGAKEDEILQVVALAATTLGFPSTVAVFTWVQDVIGP